MNIRYTVKQLAKLAHVSPRTLRFYDEIGLLKPSSLGANRYRYYDEPSLLRLQQIMFYREMDLSLNQIRDIMDEIGFTPLDALQAHRKALEARAVHVARLIETVDITIAHLKGRKTMSPKQLFEGFSDEQQARYEKEAAERYGETLVTESNQRWRSYSNEKKASIVAESEAIYRDMLARMLNGHAIPEVQDIVARWHQHLRYFYEPSLTMLRGLGQMYADDPAFADNYRRLHPDMPEFLRAAISYYCDQMEGIGSTES